MSNIKTYYHDEILRVLPPRTPAYVCTLNVQQGIIQDPRNVLDTLRAEARLENGHRAVDRETAEMSGQPQRYWKVQRVELKYRGPRHENRYRTPREYATRVDVYLYERTVWSPHTHWRDRI